MIVQIVEAGYAIICSADRSILLYTVKPNRAASWDAFCRKEDRGYFKRGGFRCVKVMVVTEEIKQ